MTVQLVVQIDGKLRDRVDVAADASREKIEETVMARDKVRQHLGDRRVVKFILVPGRLVNLVTGGA